MNESHFCHFFALAMKYEKVYPATTCSKKDTLQRAVLNEIPRLIPVQSRVIKHHIRSPCVSVTLHYTSVAAQQTKQAQVMPCSPPTNLPSNIQGMTHKQGGRAGERVGGRVGGLHAVSRGVWICSAWNYLENVWLTCTLRIGLIATKPLTHSCMCRSCWEVAERVWNLG